MALYSHLTRTEQERWRSKNEIPRARLKPRKFVQDVSGVPNVVLDLGRRDNEFLKFDKSRDRSVEDRRDLVKNGADVNGAMTAVDLIEIGKVRSPEDQQIRDQGTQCIQSSFFLSRIASCSIYDSFPFGHDVITVFIKVHLE
jgi:hypothetical protein